MKIIIAGAGNVGTHLAKLLSREKQDIILMDDDEEKLSALSANFDLLTVAASPSSISAAFSVTSVKAFRALLLSTRRAEISVRSSDCTETSAPAAFTALIVSASSFVYLITAGMICFVAISIIVRASILIAFE